MLKVFKLFRFVKSTLGASSFCQARKRKAKSLGPPRSACGQRRGRNVPGLCRRLSALRQIPKYLAAWASELVTDGAVSGPYESHHSFYLARMALNLHD